MKITVELASDEEALLLARTRSQGVEPAAYIHRVIRQDLERGERHEKNRAAIALLQKWMKEELPEAEGAEAAQNWEESMKSLDEHRLSWRALFQPVTDESA